MDVTDTNFETEVLDRSTDEVVVVDLWASWCGPCRTLGPIIEKVVGETDGVSLVKVDVDANPQVSAAFRVQSIPAVFAIKDRKVLDSFVGAIPEPAVRQWVESLVPAPSAPDLLVAQGDEASLRQALALEPGHAGAVIALAQLLVDQDTPESKAEALQLLARIPETGETRRLGALARVGDEVAEAGPGDGLDAKLDALLERVKSDDEARQEFVDLLEVLGPDDPRTATYRRALTARLF